MGGGNVASAKLMDIVMVHWVDSCEPQPNSEIEQQDIPGVQDIIQVGYLIKKTKDSISVAGAWKQELKTYDYVITIPKVSIRSIEVLLTD
jgi:hypothetical protein